MKFRETAKPKSPADRNPKPTANPVKKRPNAILSGFERQGGELKHGSGEQTHTPTVATYTHAYTHPDIPMDCIRSLKAADTNEPIQERINTRLKSAHKLYNNNPIS